MNEKPKTIEIMLSKTEFEKLKTTGPNNRIIFEAESSYDCECFTIYNSTKEAAKKPNLRKGCNWSYRCPNCGNLLFWTDEPKDHGIKYNYCPECGQHIDWNEGEN